MITTQIFYAIKPIIPRRLQILLRRKRILRKRALYKDIWPIDESANKPPQGWAGWPNQKTFALVLTHDVESAQGHDKCMPLMRLEAQMGFRSSFNFVPERYHVSSELRDHITSNGFEVGVHGLKHDGKLYDSVEIFRERASRINRYLKEWQAIGFRSPSMHHNLDWIHNLKIKYDSSTFDTDPFEPQSDGVNTIFPFWVARNGTKNGYVELPYTLAQDHALLIIMKEQNIDIWKKKLDWIAENGGMALLNTHPDYMNFAGEKLGLEEFPVQYYTDLLRYVKTKYEGQHWNALPKEVAQFYSRIKEKDFLRTTNH